MFLRYKSNTKNRKRCLEIPLPVMWSYSRIRQAVGMYPR